MSTLISPSTVIRLDGDVSNNATAFADATGLSFIANPNSDYLIEAFLVYVAAATTTGLNLGINGPASPVGVLGEWRAYTSATAALLRQFTAYNSGTPTTGVLAASSPQFAQFTAMIRTNAAGGPVTLRFASEVAGSAVTIKAGSIIRVQQLAPVSTVNTIERMYAVIQLCQNLSTMQNNMRANVQAIKASHDTPGAVVTTVAGGYTAGSGTLTVANAAAISVGTLLGLNNAAHTVLLVTGKNGNVLTVVVKQNDADAATGVAVASVSALFEDFPATQQAVRDLGRAFLQRLDLNAAVVTPHATEVSDGAAALGILFQDMTDRYNLLRTWATNLNTATITNQTELDNGVAAVLANVPASILPF
ncbi:MAG TPA: hypothetical protein VJ777_10940 [Mycobacterium sp.]|nr:hypothetical protein [Mycobacterium sp.]